jgi:uncharacterized protein YndB with AHSA1/START domain
MTRVLPATRERVFESFADAARLARWWGSDGVPHPANRLHAARRRQLSDRDAAPHGQAFHLTAAFREVDFPSRLAFSFNWEPPDQDDQDTVAELSFHDSNASTEIHLSQGPFKIAARRALRRDGWAQSFDKLRDLVAAQP